MTDLTTGVGSVRRGFVAFIATALLATALFATSVSNPAVAQTPGITFNAPTGLTVVAGQSIVIDASAHASDTGFVISCADPTGVDGQKVWVTREGCSFTVRASISAVAGDTTFSTVLTSSRSGSTTLTATFTVAITPFSVASGTHFPFALAGYPSEGAVTACGQPPQGTDGTRYVVRNITSQSAGVCTYRIEVQSSATPGQTSFTSLLTFSGGNRNVTFTFKIIDANSNIVFTPPQPNFTMLANTEATFNLGDLATDGAYTITCGEATDIAGLASVTRNSGCSYQVRATSTQGLATFNITYTSIGGDSYTAQIGITVNPNLVAPPLPFSPPPTSPPPTSPPPTTTTTIPGGSTTTTEPAPTLEPDIAGPRWNTWTVSGGGITASEIRSTLGISSSYGIYTWNTRTQTWTRVTSSSPRLSAGTLVSFRTTAAPDPDLLEDLNLGSGSTTIRLDRGWNLINVPSVIIREEDGTFLLDVSLIDCENLQGVIIVASYSARDRRWSLWLPCHPLTQARLTTGRNAPYRVFTRIEPGDTTYIYNNARQPIDITWDTGS